MQGIRSFLYGSLVGAAAVGGVVLYGKLKAGELPQVEEAYHKAEAAGEEAWAAVRGQADAAGDAVREGVAAVKAEAPAVRDRVAAAGKAAAGAAREAGDAVAGGVQGVRGRLRGPAGTPVAE